MLVLIVQDEPISALSATYELEEAGHLVDGPAATLADALRLARQFHPQLALLDIDLENVEDGVELARQFRKLNIASVFMSARARVAACNAELALGVIGKPFNPADIPPTVEVVAALLQGRPLPPAPTCLRLFH